MSVTYEKEMRDKAKSERKGLVTIDIVSADGCRTTLQIRADEKEVRYAYLALNHITKLIHEGRDT